MTTEAPRSAQLAVAAVLNLGVAGYDAGAMVRTVGAAQDLLALLGAMTDPKAMGVRIQETL